MVSKEKIRAILDGTDPKWGRSFDVLLGSLIVLSAISLALETLPDLPDWARIVLQLEEILIVLVFTLEYGLRIYVAEKPFAYIFSFWGLVDLLAIVPFYFSMRIDLRGVRVIRLVRLLWILKLMRYMRAAERLKHAFSEISDELIIFGVLSLITLYLSAVGIYYFEHDAQPDKFSSVPQALWWALATLTTVGYGDVYPITMGGRIFTFFVLLLGLGVVAVPSGLIASALTRNKMEQEAEQNKNAQEGEAEDSR